MQHESVLMVSRGQQLPEASLLFAPKHIRAVRNAGQTELYVEGADWIWEDGRLKLPRGSRAPFLTEEQLYPGEADEVKKWPLSRGGFVRGGSGHFFHSRQLVVSYAHEGTDQPWPEPEFADRRLPRLFRKLRDGEAVRVVVYGDSIAKGEESSGFLELPPHAPGWDRQIADRLRSAYPHADIAWSNVSKGGTGSAWGALHVRGLVSEQRPDLTLLAFGMNDGSAKVPPHTYLANVRRMIADVRSLKPEAECLLVIPMLPNPDTRIAAEGQHQAYAPFIRGLAGEGIAVADVMAVHRHLLAYKKYWDMTANNINHPNDFLSSVYADVVSCALIGQEAEAT